MTVTNYNTTDIKRANRNRVYQLLRKGGTFSKREVADALCMSYPTVNRNLAELQELELVREVGSLRSTGGRKAIGVEMNANARYALGLDVTRNHAAVLVLNLAGDILFDERHTLPFSYSPSYFQKIGALADGAVERLGIEPEKVLGVGISVPAIITRDRLSLCYSEVLGSSGISKKDFSEHLRYPCRLCNDSKAASSAETHSGVHPRSMIYLSLSNSVGGAIVIQDQLLEGDNERSAEFGHIKLIDGGEKCYCGQQGCLDAYCNAMVLSRLTDDNLQTFFDRLQTGDPVCSAAWQEYVDHLASAIDKLLMVFDLPVVLGGYVGSYLEPYIPLIRRRVQQINTFDAAEDRISPCKRKQEASAMGAAYSFLDAFLDSI